jgi:serine/threonine-protein kinase
MAVIEKALWQAVSPLLDELLDADEPRRDARLKEIRATDPTLANELAALLARQGAVETQQFLAGSALDVTGAATLAGRNIGSYTLERPLGAGGMGSVWLARRSDGHFEGHAAVKFLNLALLARGAGRFRREGSVLARLAHPNIARLLDAGLLAGQPYLVLEYIDGEPIDHWCDKHALGVRARLRLFLEVLGAVTHAHNNLILHRDLKPSNILVRNDGVVKLLDFGIAKLLEKGDQETPATELTQLAGRAFTPEFAAPEQVRGDDATITSDVYALGVLLYVMLSGRHPTSQPNEPTHERVRAVIEREPPLLGAIAQAVSVETAAARDSTPARLARELRGDLENIVAKALKKQPAERYPSVAAFADDLQRYLNDQPVSARRDSVAYRSGKFIRRHRLAVAAGSAIFVTLVAGVVGTTWQAIEARRERDEALFQAESARARGSLVNMIQGSIGEGGRPLSQREILDRSVQLVEKQFMRDPRIAIGLLLLIAGQYFSLGDVENDFAVMQRAGEIAAASGDPQLIADVACNTVNTEIRRGNLDKAKEQLKTGQAALQAITQPRFGSVIECLRAEADIAHEDGDLPRAIDRLLEALDHLERAAPNGADLYPSITSNLSVLYEERGDLAASFAMLKREQQHEEEAARTDSVDYLGARASEAGILMKWGEYRAAKIIIDDVESRWRDASGENSPPAWLVQRAGIVQLRVGDVGPINTRLAEAAELARARGNQGAAIAADFTRVQTLVALGRYEEGEKLLEAVEAALPVSSGRYTRITPATVRAASLLAQGRTAEGVREIEQEIARIGPSTPQNAAPLGALLRTAARVYAAAGDVPRSEQAARDAVALAERTARDPTRSADVGEALLALAQAERRAGDVAQSRATAERAVVSLAGGLGDDHALTSEARRLSKS